MVNPAQLEASYQEYIQDLSRWVPDGVVAVDLALLQQLGLLHTDLGATPPDDTLNYYFNVIETPDKLTLFNQDFVVWIVPETVDGVATTFTLIATHHTTASQEKPHLELVFTTSGVYNSSELVLRILEHFLQEIKENEDTITSIEM